MTNENLPAKKKSRIEEHNLEKEALALLTAPNRMSYEKIAEQLNEIAGLSEDDEDRITKKVVFTYAKSYPDVRREMLLADRQRKREIMLSGVEFDMLAMLKDMAARLMFMIDTMDEMAIDEGTIAEPKAYKALVSELREILKQIEGIHKSVYDMEVVRSFLKDVVDTLKDVSPHALEEFIKRMKGKRDNDHVVSELLKGR